MLAANCRALTLVCQLCHSSEHFPIKLSNSLSKESDRKKDGKTEADAREEKEGLIYVEIFSLA